MNRKFWISAGVMFVLTFVLSWGVHGGLLHGDYMQMLGWRDAKTGRHPRADRAG